MEAESGERRSAGEMQLNWPWEPEFREPASCVDWSQIEKLMRNEA